MRLFFKSLLFVLALSLLGLFSGCTAKARASRHLERADKYFQANEYSKAEVEYLNVLQIQNLEQHAVSRLGLIYFAQGRTARAYAFLTKALELDPENLDVRLKSGMLSLAIGDSKKAHEQAEAILSRSPTNSEAPLLLIQSAKTRTESEAIRQRLEKLQEQIGATAPLELAMGTFSLRSGNLVMAKAAFNRALALDPKSPAILSALGNLYWAKNDLTNADLAFKSAADLSAPAVPWRLQYAGFKLKTGNLEEGKRILTQITQDTPDYVPAWTSRAEIALTEKQLTNCAALLNQASTRDANDYNTLLLSARLKLAQGQVDTAIAELERLSSLFAQSPQVFYQLSLAYLAKNDSSKAIKNLNQAVSLNPDYLEAVLLQAQLHIQRDNAGAAIPSLNRLIKRQPRLTQAHLLLINAYFSLGNYDDALSVSQHLEELLPKNAQLSQLTGNIYLRQKKTSEARQQFEKALQLSPDYFPALEQLVNLDLADKQSDAALKRIHASQEQFPKSPALQLLLAKVFGSMDDTQKTEQALMKAIELDPNYQPAYIALARLYVASKENGKALESLNQSIAKNPKDISAWMLIGIIQTEQKDYAAARVAYEKLLAVNPNISPALNNLASLYSENLGLLNDAYDVARKARQLAPNDPYSGDTLGWILCQRKEYPWALTLLQESASRLPDQPEVQFHLGMVYYATANDDRAEAAFTRALSAGKPFPRQHEAEERLAVLRLDPRSDAPKVLADLEKRLATYPEDTIVLTKLAKIYARQGASDKAARAYEQALKLNPQNARIMVECAIFYSEKLNDPKRALDLVNEAYRLAPDNSEASYFLGRLLFAKGENKRAVSLLQQSALKQPDNLELAYDLALATYSVGDLAEAESLTRETLQSGPFSRTNAANQFLDLLVWGSDPAKALAAAPQIKQILLTHPNDVPALMVDALNSEQQHDNVKATATYEQVLKQYPEFLPAIRRMAILTAEKQGGEQKTYDWATQARQAFPADPEVAKALGLCLYQRSEYQQAARLLDEAVRQTPEDGKGLFYLGMARFQLKDSKQSKAALQRALALKLPNDLAQTAQQTLVQLK